MSLNAGDKLKMKSGSFMSGEVIQLTETGLLFKMEGMTKLVEFQWDVIDDECKSALITKYGIAKPEPKAEEIPKKSEEIPDPKTEGPKENVKNEVVEINYSNLGHSLLLSYLSNLKTLTTEMVSGVDYMVVDGLQIKTNDGRVLRGVQVKETDVELHLKFNDLPINIKKEDVASTKKILLKMKKGTITQKDFLKYAETTLHENCLKLAASEEGIRYEEAKYIWGVRISGGVLPTETGEKKFLGYKFNRSIDLSENSHLFGNKNSATGLKSFPDEEWWKAQRLTAKENIIMAITILKNFPRTSWSDRVCPACKGEGVIKASEFDRGGEKSKDKKSINPEKPKEKEVGNKDKTCKACNGITKFYTLKYE